MLWNEDRGIVGVPVDESCLPVSLISEFREFLEFHQLRVHEGCISRQGIRKRLANTVARWKGKSRSFRSIRKRRGFREDNAESESNADARAKAKVKAMAKSGKSRSETTIRKKKAAG